MIVSAPAPKERVTGPQPGARRSGRPASTVCLVLAIALALAGCIRLLHSVFSRQPEKAVLATGVLFGAVVAATLGAYFWRARRDANPATAGLLFLAALSVAMLGSYFYWVSWYVAFPADILTWSEGDYVNDIIKFTVGYPLFSPQANNDSFTYVPGSQVLTYGLAWVAGHGSSISVFRLLQVIYTALAAFVALLCCRRIGRAGGRAWTVFQYSALLLIAANSITNRFTHNLHGDALAQLLTLAGYWLLLIYIDTRDRRALALMALVSPVGFFVRQSLIVWAALYVGFLAVWARDWKRIFAFTFATTALTAAVIGGCYAVWGEPFFYWTFRVLGAHAVSPLRSFQHALDAWPYFAGGLLGGALVLRGRVPGALFGAWLAGLALLALETYTSGVAWMLNHMGPGCLIAGVWFLAGFQLLWSDAAICPWRGGHLQDWIAAGTAALSVALLFNGMGMVRVPFQPISDDAYRYVRDIEAQFRGLPADRVLLDAGAWNHLPGHVVMGDRAPSIGERGYSQTGDWSGILLRIASHRYQKILVRDFDQPDFWYEHSSWPKPSGIRQALVANYRVTGRIPAAQPPISARDRAEDPYLFSEITILEPKTSE